MSIGMSKKNINKWNNWPASIHENFEICTLISQIPDPHMEPISIPCMTALPGQQIAFPLADLTYVVWGSDKWKPVPRFPLMVTPGK